MPNRIIMLHSGLVCYDSTAYFGSKIKEYLEKNGTNVDIINCNADNMSELLIQQGKCDAIVDINTKFPSVIDESGNYVFDNIEIPVWHYILDHPLYHHDVLKCELSNMNVICIDRDHCNYVREHYPHIRNVVCMPVPGEQSEHMIPYMERGHQVIFTGTYTSSQELMTRVSRCSEPQIQLFNGTVQLLLDHPEYTLEKATVQILGHMSERPEMDIQSVLPEIMQGNYMSDMYLRAALREELVIQMLKIGIDLEVYGHGWEKMSAMCDEFTGSLILGGEIEYAKLPDLYADSQIVLNQMPWFKAGMHDRVPLALNNGCVCVTDESEYIDDYFIDGENICTYSLEDMEGAAKIVAELKAQPEEAARIALRGYACGIKSFSWNAFAKTLINNILDK